MRSRVFVLETLVPHLPHEDFEQQFNMLVRWAWFGEMFARNEAAEDPTPS